MVPDFAKTVLETLRVHNIQLVYKQYNTTTEQFRTWLRADLVFFWVLQLVSDFFKNICGQERRMLRVESILSPLNDWTIPIQVSNLAFRSTLPNISIKVGDIFTTTELGVSISFTNQREPWPPFNEKWIHTRFLWQNDYRHAGEHRTHERSVLYKRKSG